MSNIFITGGTGFLGSDLICEILNSSSNHIYALVRARNITHARRKLFNILEKLSQPRGLNRAARKRIHVYKGDITRKNLDLKRNDLNKLVKTIDVIFHSAASTNLKSPLKKIRRINVNGTKRVLDFALLCQRQGRLKKVYHISTVYVAGTKICTFKEKDLNIRQGFNNHYERSKFEAEQLIHRYRKRGKNISIFRPSIMLGRYKDGISTRFKMLYQPLHFLSFELIDTLPVIKEGKPNLINVDIAAKTIMLISQMNHRKNKTYHITSPDALPLSYVLGMASKFFGFKNPRLAPPNSIDMNKDYTPVKRKIIEPYLPYFNYLTKFDMKNTLDQIKKTNFVFPQLNKKNLYRLFKYCDEVGFIKKKRKNVV